nr:MAG TPA: restriction alleviation protein [Caudoviricetes sp.]
MEELKPCPFCGGKPVLKFEKRSSCGRGRVIRVECTKCYVGIYGYSPDLNCEETALDNIENCKRNAIRDWNRRASDDK